MKKFKFENYFKEVRSFISDDISTLNKLKLSTKLFLKCKNKKKKVILIGNGGSASTASHVSVDLSKNSGVRAVNFNEPNLITCFSNDYGYENYFKEAIRIYGDVGDIIVFISCSGESKNLVNAIKFCKKKKYKCITFTGRKKNNTLKKLNKSGINLWVNSHSYNIIESVHMLWLLSIVDNIIGTSIYEPK